MQKIIKNEEVNTLIQKSKDLTDQITKRDEINQKSSD